MSVRAGRLRFAACAASFLSSPAFAADRLEARFGIAAFGAVDPLRDVKTVAGCGYACRCIFPRDFLAAAS